MPKNHRAPGAPAPDTPDHPRPQPSFAIIAGIGEGRLTSWRMRRALRAQGYREAAAAEAEVIITHSGGIYVMPRASRAALYVHIHCSQYMSFGRLIIAHWQKIGYDLRRRYARRQLIRWLLALLTNGWYLLNIPRGYRMWRGFRRCRTVFNELPPTGRHVFVCGPADSLSDPPQLLRYGGPRHNYVTIDGGHDDCWREPAPYVTLISLLRTSTEKGTG